MFEERKIKNKTLELYKLLSRSDFKGNYEDAYTIEQLFTMLCLDVLINVKGGHNIKGGDLLDLAKEVIRLFELDDGDVSNYSVMNWCKALWLYMVDANKKYKDIHSMNTYDLRNEVSNYLESGD